MERSRVLFIIVVVIGLAAFLWYDQSGMAEASSTPEKAVQEYVGENPVYVIEIMELEDSVYVFHEPVAYHEEGRMSVTRVDKVEYGWKAVTSLTFGPEITDWASTIGTTVGSAHPETKKVIVSGVEALLYTFKSTGKIIYLIHDQEVEMPITIEEMGGSTIQIGD